MIFANTLSLVLALAPATLFAAPTQTFDSIAQLIPRQDLPKPVVDELRKTNALCDLSNVVLPVGMFPPFLQSILPYTNNYNSTNSPSRCRRGPHTTTHRHWPGHPKLHLRLSRSSTRSHRRHCHPLQRHMRLCPPQRARHDRHHHPRTQLRHPQGS